MLQRNLTARAACAGKTTSTCKAIHPNIDDTGTEDSTNNDKGSAYLAKAWMEEWKSYINSIEDVPEGMSLVRWWGVCILFHSCVINAC